MSHSKKWPRLKQLDENGEPDNFFQHMREHGFDGFERGERGSTNEHLSVMRYKTKQEQERAAHFTAIAEEKQQTADVFSYIFRR